MHGVLARTLHAIAREAGMEASYEQVVPELIKGTPGDANVVDAKLDLHLWAGALGAEQY